ncbi:MAG: universal stress protein [Sphingomonadaceae bacterium]|nr:universal stress protein [Sphingomonadaceae bacterium]
MRSILLHVHDDDGLESRLQAALDLARAMEGHVTFLQAVSYDVIMPGDFFGGMGAEIIPVIREQAQTLREKLEQRMAGEDVRWDWLEESGWAETRLMEHAALSDVLVVSATEPQDMGGGPSRLAGDVAINARTPVLVVPRGVSGFDCSGPAVVGWDGSPEASRALRAAVPLLQKASSVVLATVTREGKGPKYDLPPTSGAEFLSRHDIAAEMVELSGTGGHPSELLGHAAMERGASVLVMGAYGQSRLLESMLGGVTHRMLADPPLPLLMAH